MYFYLYDSVKGIRLEIFKEDYNMLSINCFV